MDELFNKVGLNKNEREVYLAVLKAGKISPQRVSVLTGINRTTVYSVAKKLQSMGLITEDLGQKVGYLVAVSPENLVGVFEKEEKKIGEKKKAAIELSKELAKLSGDKKYSVPRIKFVEEDNLNDYMYKVYGAWAESGLRHDNTWWGYHDSSFTENYGKFVDYTWTHGPPGLKVRFLTNSVAPMEEEMKKKHPERLFVALSPNNEFDSSLWIIGDYVIMGQTRARPHYLVEIHDEVLARNQRQLFKSLWEMASGKEKKFVSRD